MHTAPHTVKKTLQKKKKQPVTLEVINLNNWKDFHISHAGITNESDCNILTAYCRYYSGNEVI